MRSCSSAKARACSNLPSGSIPFSRGDYLVIPRGILHRYRFSSEKRLLLIIESAGYVRTPKRYRNEFGQLTESSPYGERDIRGPEDLETHDEKGEFKLIVKKANTLTEMVLASHPFDLIGWDGYYYPWAINIAQLRTARRPLPSSSANPSDVRRRRLRRLFFLPTSLRFRSGSCSRAL